MSSRLSCRILVRRACVVRPRLRVGTAGRAPVLAVSWFRGGGSGWECNLVRGRNIGDLVGRDAGGGALPSNGLPSLAGSAHLGYCAPVLQPCLPCLNAATADFLPMTSLAGLVKAHEYRVPHETFARAEHETKADACYADFERKLRALDTPDNADYQRKYEIAAFAPNEAGQDLPHLPHGSCAPDL